MTVIKGAWKGVTVSVGGTRVLVGQSRVAGSKGNPSNYTLPGLVNSTGKLALNCLYEVGGSGLRPAMNCGAQKCPLALRSSLWSRYVPTQGVCPCPLVGSDPHLGQDDSGMRVSRDLREMVVLSSGWGLGLTERKTAGPERIPHQEDGRLRCHWGSDVPLKRADWGICRHLVIGGSG